MSEQQLAPRWAGLRYFRSGIAQSHHQVGPRGPVPLLLLLVALLTCAAELLRCPRPARLILRLRSEDIGFRVTAPSASGATTSSAIGAATVTTAWPGSFKIRNNRA